MSGCFRCGQYVDAPTLTASDDCAVCGHHWLRLPLFALSGASGVGKSTVCALLPTLLPQVVAFDTDVLWRPEYWRSEAEMTYHRRTLLLVAIHLHQSGRPVVLCGSSIPAHWEHLADRTYLDAIHYLALVCDEDVHVRRLHDRSPEDPKEDEHYPDFLNFNRWLRAHGPETDPAMTVLDTTAQTADQTARAVAAWIREQLSRAGTG